GALHRTWRRRVSPHLDHRDSCALMGFHLEIPPGVLHPGHFASSQFLARHLGTLPYQNKWVADIGTGSGLLALVVANKGATVTALDINPQAVTCARDNAFRNGLGDRITAIESDVFGAVPPVMRFDYVVTNPPFYPRDARDLADQAFAAGSRYDFFITLTHQIRNRLTEKGMLILVHSSDVNFAPIADMFASRGLIEHSVRHKRGLFETLSVREYRIDLTT
ncbi:MAG: class I SAM-dependent methyltransferase, partial [Vicinamibacteria bacterium]